MADIKNIQSGFYYGKSGQDIYSLTEENLKPGTTSVITDAAGVNTLHCENGLQVAESKIAADSLILTLDNGATVVILNADAMKFQVGGDPEQGEPGLVLSYREFVVQELETTFPEANEVLQGSSATIGSNEYAGKVIDGFIKDAFVFADANGNGTYDEGESHTQTDGLGNFELDPSAQGELISIGGTDISTGLAFSGTMTAPSGATVITPSTTLINQLVQQGYTTADAQKTVNKALGLPEDTGLMFIDPLTDLDNNDDQGNDNALMLKIHAANLKIATAMTQMGAVVKGASQGLLDDNASYAIVGKALASQLLSDKTLDLTKSSTVKETLQKAAEQAKNDLKDNSAFDKESFQSRLDQSEENASEIISTTTGKIIDAMDDADDLSNPIDAVREAVKIQGVAHGQAKDQLEQGTSQGNLNELLNDFKNNLSDKASAFDEPDNVVTGEDGTDEDGTGDNEGTDDGDTNDNSTSSGGGAPAPVVPVIKLVTDTGSSNSDNISNKGSFTVSNLTSGKAWEFSVDGGQNWVLAVEGVGNTSSILNSPNTVLQEGEYAAGQIKVRYKETMQVIAENKTKVVIDQTKPNTTSGTALVSDSGIDAADTITNTATGLKGTAEAGATVEVLSGNTSLGTTTANDQGAWTLTADLSAYSGQNLSITQTDLAGNTAASAETFSFTLDIDAPTASFSSAITSSISNNTLNLEPGATVAAVSTEKGEAWLVLKSESPTSYSDLGTLQADSKAVKATLTESSSSSNYAVDVNTAGLSEGDYKLVTVDVAGNISSIAQSESSDITVSLTDTTAPAAPTLTLVDTSDSGTNNSDGISNQKTPTVKVTLPNGNTAAATDALVGDTVTVYSGTDQNKVSVGTIVLTASHITAGSVEVTLSDLGADGEKALTATIKDQSSTVNESAASGALTYTLDTTAPDSAPGVTKISLSKDTSAKDQDDTAEDAQDTGDSDLITKHAAQTLTFTLGSALGDGESLYVTSGTGDNAQWTIATKDSTDSSGVTYTLSDQTLTAGDTTYQFAIGDAAGNRGTAQTQQNSEFTVTLDTTAPTTLVSGIDISADTGDKDDDFITKTASQTITATLSAGLATGETLWGSYSTSNGRTEWVDITNTVNGQSVSWDSVTLDASGTIKMEVRDAAGNAGSVAQGQTDTQSQDYVLDTTSPQTTITGASYNATDKTLTLAGTKFTELLGSAETGTTDIKGRLDWSKITWDIEGDGATTANVTFSKDDIDKAVVGSDTALKITLTDAVVSAMPTNWDGEQISSDNGNDNIVIDAGFTADAAGNTSSSDAYEGPNAMRTDIVVFDLVNGVSSNHSDRKFDPDTTYTIYIVVDGTAASPSLDVSSKSESAPQTASWGMWSQAYNIGNDDQIVIVGQGGNIGSAWGINGKDIGPDDEMAVHLEHRLSAQVISTYMMSDGSTETWQVKLDEYWRLGRDGKFSMGVVNHWNYNRNEIDVVSLWNDGEVYEMSSLQYAASIRGPNYVNPNERSDHYVVKPSSWLNDVRATHGLILI